MENNSYLLLIHTMTITQSDFIVQAQFFHAFSEDLVRGRLVGKRMSLRVHPSLRNSRNKTMLQRLYSPNLKSLMKRKAYDVRHHLRAVHVNPQNHNVLPSKDDITLDVRKNGVQDPPVTPPLENKTFFQSNNNNNIHLSQLSTTQEINEWLSQNRFEKYLDTFERFSGDDMLRMSREDLMQICGNADGIRLHNAIHSKTIAPKLKMYVCQENSSIFNAVFLSSYSNKELLQKLSTLIGISQNQVRDVYLEGPHSIHVQLNNDLLKHIKEETMFTLQIISEENNSCILLLKRAVK